MVEWVKDLVTTRLDLDLSITHITRILCKYSYAKHPWRSSQIISTTWSSCHQSIPHQQTLHAREFWSNCRLHNWFIDLRIVSTLKAHIRSVSPLAISEFIHHPKWLSPTGLKMGMGITMSGPTFWAMLSEVERLMVVSLPRPLMCV